VRRQANRSSEAYEVHPTGIRLAGENVDEPHPEGNGALNAR